MKNIITVIIIIQLQSIVSCQNYKMLFKNYEYCPDPDPPYEQDNKVLVSLEVVNKTESFYFKGNFSVQENLSGYSWRFKSGFDQSGKVIYDNDFEGLSCRSFIPKLIYEVAKVKYNSKTCYVVKMNAIDRAAHYLPSKRFGINIYYLSYYKPQGTAFCIQLRIVFIKA